MREKTYAVGCCDTEINDHELCSRKATHFLDGAPYCCEHYERVVTPVIPLMSGER